MLLIFKPDINLSSHDFFDIFCDFIYLASLGTSLDVLLPQINT